MQGGDISNEVPMRVYVVFEGTLGIPKADQTKKRRWGRRPSAAEMLDQFDIDDQVAMNLWDIGNRVGVRFDCVTFMGTPMVDALKEMLDGTNLPISNVWGFDSPYDLASRLAFMPWVSHVVDHQNPMAYGSKASTLAGVRR